MSSVRTARVTRARGAGAAGAGGASAGLGAETGTRRRGSSGRGVPRTTFEPLEDCVEAAGAAAAFFFGGREALLDEAEGSASALRFLGVGVALLGGVDAAAGAAAAELLPEALVLPAAPPLPLPPAADAVGRAAMRGGWPFLGLAAGVGGARPMGVPSDRCPAMCEGGAARKGASVGCACSVERSEVM